MVLYSMKLSFMIVTYGRVDDVVAILTTMSGLVDELVVVHDGPEIEDTLSAAESLGAKTHATEQRMGFATPHRQLTREMCTGDWVLWSDTDERWEGELLALRDEIARIDALAFETIMVRRHNIHRGSQEMHPRIFKNSSSFRFNDIMHYVHDGISKPTQIDSVWIEHYDVHDQKTPDGKYVHLDYMIDKMKRYKEGQRMNRLKYANNPNVLNRVSLNYDYDAIIAKLEKQRV